MPLTKTYQERCGVQNMRSSPWLHPVRNKIIQVSQLWRRRRFDTNWRCALWFELWCDIYEEFWSCYFHLKDNVILQNIVEDLEKKLAKASNLPRPWTGHLLNTAPIRRLVPARWLGRRLTRFWRLEISCPFQTICQGENKMIESPTTALLSIINPSRLSNTSFHANEVNR